MIEQIVFIASVVCLGLMAGLFYAWAVSVTNGIGRLADRDYLRAFQAMNRAILNPLFLGPFLLSFVLPAINAFLFYQAFGLQGSVGYYVGAFAIYFFGVVVVTVAGNVPLNNHLEAFDVDNASEEDCATLREAFEGAWNRFHLTRTVCAIAAFVLLLL